MYDTNTHTLHGETNEEWISRAENLLRLTENAAKYSAGEPKAILLRSADEQQHQIRRVKRELAERTRRNRTHEARLNESRLRALSMGA